MSNAESIAAPTYRQASNENAPLKNEQGTKANGRLKELFSNETILHGLKARDKQVIRYVYQNNFQTIRHMILSNSGSPMDAEDVFQDAMLAIYRKITTEQMELTCSFSTYLYAVCRNIWFHRIEDRKKLPEMRDLSDLEPADDVYDLELSLVENDKFKLFHDHFEKLNEADRQVLKLFFKKVPLAEIAIIMGYKSTAYAKVKKFLTKEKLKNSIVNDPRYRRLLHQELLNPVFNS